MERNIWMVEVREANSTKEKKAFVKFPLELYKDCPQFVPFLLSDELDNFNPKKNPAFDFCEAKMFLAYRDGRVVGRIGAIISHAANQKWGTSRIRFTRVDFIDDYEVSQALFDAVIAWGREKGLQEIHGPMGFSDLDQEGMLIEDFDQDNNFITIYNYAYYKEHMARLGFDKDVDWVEYKIKIPEQVDPRIERLSQLVMKRSKMKMASFKSKREIRPYLKGAMRVINEAFENLYGTVPITDKLIQKYFSQFMMLINPHYVRMIIDENDEPVGVGFMLPSMNDCVRKSKGRLFPFGWIRILRAPYKKTDVIDLYLVGVKPKYQKQGHIALMLNDLTKEAIENHGKYAETGPELETNEKIQALWKSYEATQHKRRRCWIKKIG